MKKFFADSILYTTPCTVLLSIVTLFSVSRAFADEVICMVFWIGGGLSLLAKALTLLQYWQQRRSGPGINLTTVVLLFAVFLLDLVLTIGAFYISSPLWLSGLYCFLAILAAFLLLMQTVCLLRGGNVTMQTLGTLATLFLLMLVFLVCLGVGFSDSDYKIRIEDSGEDSVITLFFSQLDHVNALNEIRNNFDEEIFYKTTGVSELTTTDAGISYYSITYLICTESTEQVTTYLYYKFATDSPDYKAGDLICMTSGISSSLTREDVFPEGLS